MQPVAPSGTLDVLERFHVRLDVHFAELCAARGALGNALVFALEHDLSDAELAILQESVRAAVAQGFTTKHRKWWLPFVVYAAESGYGYTGKEYWQTFAEQTPMWDYFGDRDRIRAFFTKFAENYGGVVPRGAFAETFTIISWPIANAVLPTSLQGDLAQLLFEFQGGLTPELLAVPEELGRRLAARSGGYTEQFRIFCSNTTLLGSVAAALLSGEGDESPYLIPSTLARIVASLSVEQESRQWLASARRVASRVRARGFVSGAAPAAQRSAGDDRLPVATDPRLTLKREDGLWRAFVTLPDLSVLGSENPTLYEELRGRRARVDGAERPFLPRGWLLSPGLEIRLARWPRPDTAFVQLENCEPVINGLLRARCVIGAGPTWLFRRRDAGPAVEVKGKVVRPGSSYVLVVPGALPVTPPPWISETPADIAEARVLGVTIPKQVAATDVEALRLLGLGVVADVIVRPVGVVASAWDGEGGMEWLAGEPGMLSIGTQLAPGSCLVTLDGRQHAVAWRSGQRECFLVLDDLNVGTHEVGITLIAASGRPLVQETVVITIRDPQVRPDTATSGEGIRVLASPARPSLSDLFDGRAVLTIDGPGGTPADVSVSLRSESGELRTEVHRTVELPLSAERWSKLVKSIRGDRKVADNYDAAESAHVVVSRAGIGFASLICDRGFKPLRWRLSRRHDGSHCARLIDRTDRASTVVELFTVEDPLVSVRCTPDEAVAVPALGGLLRAMTGDARAAVLLPTQPMRVLQAGSLKPFVATSGRTSQEMARLIDGAAVWATAEFPGDAFAERQQQHVLDAVTRTLVSEIAGNYWTKLEGRLARAEHLIDHLDDLRHGVGLEQRHQMLAQEVASHLWEWVEPGPMLAGFSKLVAPALGRGGMAHRPAAGRFLLLLAGRPSDLAEWDAAERDRLLSGVLMSPVLIRLARFAVLGVRALKEADEAAKGF